MPLAQIVSNKIRAWMDKKINASGANKRVKKQFVVTYALSQRKYRHPGGPRVCLDKRGETVYYLVIKEATWSEQGLFLSARIPFILLVSKRWVSILEPSIPGLT